MYRAFIVKGQSHGKYGTNDSSCFVLVADLLVEVSPTQQCLLLLWRLINTWCGWGYLVPASGKYWVIQGTTVRTYAFCLQNKLILGISHKEHISRDTGYATGISAFCLSNVLPIMMWGTEMDTWWCGVPKLTHCDMGYLNWWYGVPKQIHHGVGEPTRYIMMWGTQIDTLWYEVPKLMMWGTNTDTSWCRRTNQIHHDVGYPNWQSWYEVPIMMWGTQTDSWYGVPKLIMWGT